jgi:tRNA-dihydrouridine synthase A
MMDWTDRHCRFFHRVHTGQAVLCAEIVTALAIKHGARHKILDFDVREQPVVPQFGGSERDIEAGSS